MIRRLALPALACLALAGCVDPYGRPDYAGSALLGAGVGAATGLAVAGASEGPRYYGGGYYAAPPAYYAPPPPRYYRPYGYYPPPRRYWGW